jgi:hypothetical protein
MEVTEETKELVIKKDEHGNIIYDKNGIPVQEFVVTKTVKKIIPPDPTSMIFWLKNRRPESWRDKTEVEHSGGVKLEDFFGKKDDSK